MPRKPHRPANTNKEAPGSFIICPKDSRLNLLRLSYILPRHNVKGEALYLYIKMLESSSSAFLSERSLLQHLEGLYGAKLSIDVDVFDRDYILNFNIEAPEDDYLRTIKNIKLEMVGAISLLVNKSYQRDDSKLVEAKAEAIRSLNRERTKPSFLAKEKASELFFKSNSFFESLLKNEVAINAINDVDLLIVKEEIKTALCYAIYIGRNDAKTCLKIAGDFTISPYIPALRVNEVVINKPIDEVIKVDYPTSLVEAYFLLPAVKSEYDYVLSLIVENALFSGPSSLFRKELYQKLNLCHSLNLSKNIYSGIYSIEARCSETKSKRLLDSIKRCMDSDFNMLSEDLFNRAKSLAKLSLISTKSSEILLADYLQTVTNLHLERELDIYLAKLEEIKLTNLKTYLKRNAYIGSIIVEGK